MNIVIIQNNIYLATYVCKIVALELFSFRVNCQYYIGVLSQFLSEKASSLFLFKSKLVF